MDKKELERVAFTARLDLSQEEEEELEGELEAILGWFSKIDEVETENVDPAFHPIDLKNEMREDEVEEPLDQEEAMENSDNKEDGFFKGPKIR